MTPTRLTEWFFGRDRNVHTAVKPKISFVVIVYDMPRQAENTLLSLCAGYQDGADPDDYEVIVVENASQRNLPPELVDSLPDNYHYFLRHTDETSPVNAINYGAEQARGEQCDQQDEAFNHLLST